MPTIGLIGGTGDIGTALAVHLTKKYDSVLLGSRSKERAEKTILKILSDKKDREDIKIHLRPEANERVVELSEDLILTVPSAVAIHTIKALERLFRKDQLLISAVASIVKSGNEFIPRFENSSSEHSISKSIQDLIPEVKIATAFQTVPAKVLYREEELEADVFVACNDRETYARAARIVSSVSKLRPFHAGSLELSSVVEGLTAMLLNASIESHLRSPTLRVSSF